MNKPKEKLNFPDNAVEIIDDIFKEFNIKESGEEIIKKFQRGKLSTTRKIVNLVRQAKRGEISKKEMVKTIEEKVGFSKKKSTNLAEELFSRLVNPENKEEKETEDPYRESIK